MLHEPHRVASGITLGAPFSETDLIGDFELIKATPGELYEYRDSTNPKLTIYAFLDVHGNTYRVTHEFNLEKYSGAQTSKIKDIIEDRLHKDYHAHPIIGWYKHDAYDGKVAINYNSWGRTPSITFTHIELEKNTFTTPTNLVFLNSTKSLIRSFKANHKDPPAQSFDWAFFYHFQTRSPHFTHF